MADRWDMGFSGFNKSDVMGTLIPGFIAGCIIGLALIAIRFYPVLPGLLAERFFILAYCIAPLLLIMTGGVAELLRTSGQRTGWKPKIPYCAGLLGSGIALLLDFSYSAMTQYIPILEPGLAPRLAFASGRVLILIPIIIIVSGIFALFSCAGGYLVYRIRMKVQ